MKKTAPHELRSRIAGLIAHEHSHLNGYNEAQAERIQDTVLRFVDIIFPKQKEVYTQFERGIRKSLYSIDHKVQSLILDVEKNTTEEAKVYYRETIASARGQINVLLSILPQDLQTGGVPLSFSTKVKLIKSTLTKLYLQLMYLKNVLAYGESYEADDQSGEEDVEESREIAKIIKRLKAIKLEELVVSISNR